MEIAAASTQSRTRLGLESIHDPLVKIRELGIYLSQ